MDEPRRLVRSSFLPNEEQIHALHALGYVGFTGAIPNPNAGLPDPKNFISKINEISNRRRPVTPCRAEPSSQ